MNNCLITTLKASVDNNNLLKLGEILVEIEPNGVFGNGLWQNQEGTSVISIVSGSATISRPEGATFPFLVPKTVGSRVTITAGSEGAVLKISDKYNLICADGILYHQAFTWSQINFFKNLEYVPWSKGNNTGVLNISGNLDEIADGNNWDSMVLGATVLDGDISNFGKSRKFTSIAAYNCNKLYGTLESLVIKAREYRPTNSTGITLNGFDGCQVTFNGSNILGESDSLTNAVLRWTASTITFNGVTINA